MEQLENILKKMEAIRETAGPLPRRNDAASFESKKCKLCDGLGWIYNPDNTVAPCGHVKAERFDRHQNRIDDFLDGLRIGMPARFKRDRIQRWDLDLVPQAIKQIMDNKVQCLAQGLASHVGLFLYGPPGVGKTYASCYIVNSLLDARIMHCAFFNYPRLLAVIRDNFYNPEVLDRIKTMLFEVPLVALDDLGMERKAHDPDTSWSVDLLYQVIDYRCDNFKPVLITTNRDPEELEEQIKKGVWSRIRGMTDTHRIILDGEEDLRPHNKNVT